MDFALDFGTTNSVLAWRDADGRPQTWQFDYADDVYDTYRSVLYMEPEGSGSFVQSWAGPAAMAEYRAYGDGGRLLQSLKSHLASAQFTGTTIFNIPFKLEQLIERFLRQLREDAGKSGITLGKRLTIGRPVHFVGENADEQLALSRLRTAFLHAGFDDCRFVEEPIAAAYAFAQRTTAPGLVLIADLGGGTTDFALVDIITPGMTPQMKVIATGGVGVAGDDLDAAIIDHVVAPRLGRDGLLQNGQAVPRWLYDYVRRWHHLSFLRVPATLRLLRELATTAKDAPPLEMLEQLVVGNQGFALAQAVGATKAALSKADAAPFSFRLGENVMEATVSRADFESWTAPLRIKMMSALDEMLAGREGQVAHVFMTGGTSYVPSIYQLFADKFPQAELHRGAELTSVAAGLVLAA